jgi:ABC-type polysaccharide/polyol phosphate transport system ATPase subunit
MNRDIAIKVDNVSKSFKIPHEKHTSLKSAALNVFKKKTYTKLETAKNISFEVKKGEFFGIIGRNGSGKSTMLKMLANIYLPDSGKIAINGRLSPFLELGVGFNPELTGRENIFLNATMLGLARKETIEKFEEIVEFSELSEFIDQKLKNYSSGMQVRLAFSVAIHAHADVLLIDEVLAVGDTNFQKKCLEVFRSFKESGKTVVFITHSMSYVREFCDRTAVMNAGKLEYIGDTEVAIDKYNKLNIDYSRVDLGAGADKAEDRLGSGGATIEGFQLLDSGGNPTKKLEVGRPFSIKIKIRWKKYIKNPAVGVMFRLHPSENLYGLNNIYSKIKFEPKEPDTFSEIVITDSMPLNPGNYFLTVSVSDQLSEVEYEELDTLNNVSKIMIFSKENGWGLIASKPKFEIKDNIK